MLRKLASELLPVIRRKPELTFVYTRNIQSREYGASSSLRVEANTSALHMDEELREIFRFKDTKISNWIIEVTARAMLLN